jgi:hypothetical protein
MASLYRGVADQADSRASMHILCDFDAARRGVKLRASALAVGAGEA